MLISSLLNLAQKCTQCGPCPQPPANHLGSSWCDRASDQWYLVGTQVFVLQFTVQWAAPKMPPCHLFTGQQLTSEYRLSLKPSIQMNTTTTFRTGCVWSCIYISHPRTILISMCIYIYMIYDVWNMYKITNMYTWHYMTISSPHSFTPPPKRYHPILPVAPPGYYWPEWVAFPRSTQGSCWPILSLLVELFFWLLAKKTCPDAPLPTWMA